MKDLFQNKYKVPSARLGGYNYALEGAYFITICTKEFHHFFGEVIDGSMNLSSIGNLVDHEWKATPGIRPDMNLELGEYVIMPNHIHAILYIGPNAYNAGNEETANCRDAMHCVSTTNAGHKKLPIIASSAIIYPYKTGGRFGPQSKNLSSVIRGFKSAVTIQARRINPDFAWQPRFHDHIIRSDESHHRISEYIRINPMEWNKDKYFTK